MLAFCSFSRKVNNQRSYNTRFPKIRRHRLFLSGSKISRLFKKLAMTKAFLPCDSAYRQPICKEAVGKKSHRINGVPWIPLIRGNVELWGIYRWFRWCIFLRNKGAEEQQSLGRNVKKCTPILEKVRIKISPFGSLHHIQVDLFPQSVKVWNFFVKCWSLLILESL